MRAELESLVRIDAPTGDADGIREVVSRVRALLGDAAGDVREIDGDSGPHLFAERPGADPPLVLVAHSDTVWPRGEAGRRPPVERDGKLYGPGVYDMRAGLGLIAWSLRCLREAGIEYRRRLLVFVGADEEKGSRTARGPMAELLPASATALVPEPPTPDGSVKISRKGVGIYEVSIRGRESHAGVDPDRGVSAVLEAARVTLELDGWKDPEAGLLVNVGTIEGGTATNVVAGRATCGVDLRFDRPEDGLEFEARLRRLEPSRPGLEIEVRGGLEFPPMVPTARSRHLGRIAVDLARTDFGLEISAGRSGGGSDGSHLAARGLTVLDGLGVDGGGAHALDEHVRLDRIPLRAAFFTRLLLELESAPETAVG